jgi:hypothetical protein
MDVATDEDLFGLVLRLCIQPEKADLTLSESYKPSGCLENALVNFSSPQERLHHARGGKKCPRTWTTLLLQSQTSTTY